METRNAELAFQTVASRFIQLHPSNVVCDTPATPSFRIAPCIGGKGSSHSCQAHRNKATLRYLMAWCFGLLSNLLSRAPIQQLAKLLNFWLQILQYCQHK
jgi:hypothetical protein